MGTTGLKKTDLHSSLINQIEIDLHRFEIQALHSGVRQEFWDEGRFSPF